MKLLRLALPLLLAACGSSPEGAQLSVTVLGEPERGLAQRLEAEATRPGLVARDGSGQIVAGLASSWRFLDDGGSLILRLRPVKWSDGRALTADDVVAAFRRAASRREPALGFAGITGAPLPNQRGIGKLGVAAPISRVVELRLTGASSQMLGWLADPALAITRAGGKAPTLAAYTASGTADARLLTRRLATASPDARPAAIRIGITADSRGAVAAFARGDSDIVLGDGLAGLGDARTGARADALRIDPVWGYYGYIANAKTGPLADPAVRRALAMAIDRPGLITRFGIPAIVPADGLLPHDQPSTRAAGEPPEPAMTDWLTSDLATRRAVAVQMLADAGYLPEKPLRLVVLLPPGRDHRSVAEIVGADWRAIGVVLAVSEAPKAEIARQVAAGRFDLALTEAALPDPDAAAALARWRCGAGQHCNPAADALLDQARAAPAATRPALLAQAETEMLTGPPLIPLFTAVRWALVARNVDGWVPNRAASHPLARLVVTSR